MLASFCQVYNPALSCFRMCRCEAFLHVQKRNGLRERSPHLHIPKGLNGSRYALTGAINSHPGDTILYGYQEVKEKMAAGSDWWLVTGDW